MTRSPNGGIDNGAYLAATSNFFTIYSLIGQTAGDFGSTPSNTQNLEKLMETVMTVTNAKYMLVTSAVVDLSVSGNRAIYGFGTNFNQAATTVYTVKFMTEQVDFLTAAILTTLLEGNSAIVLDPTTGVPSSGGAVTLSAYEMTDAAATNTTVTVVSL